MLLKVNYLQHSKRLSQVLLVSGTFFSAVSSRISSLCPCKVPYLRSPYRILERNSPVRGTVKLK